MLEGWGLGAAGVLRVVLHGLVDGLSQGTAWTLAEKEGSIAASAC